MSVTVELGQLAATLERFGYAYLVTVNDESRVHLLAVSPRLTADGLVVEGLGRHSTTNAASHPAVTLVWPPADPRDFSLIVDGTALVGDAQVTVKPTKAILHRAAPGTDGSRRGSDCRPLAVVDRLGAP